MQPYDTTPTKNYRLDPIRQEIKRSLINGELRTAVTTKGDDLKDIFLITADNADVPQFAHPLPLEFDGKSVWVIDVRGMTRVARDGTLTTVSAVDYELAITRVVLSQMWYEGGASDLLALGKFPAIVFTRWLSENISRRAAIDPVTQMRLGVICALYYYQQFYTIEDWDDAVKVKVLANISQYTRIPMQTAMEIGTDIGYMSGIEGLVTALKEHSDSVRFDTFNVGLLYSMFMGSWFGSNARETIAVSLEHPPTFMALIFMALKERSFRKTALAQIVLVSDKQDLGRTYTYNLLGLLGSRR